MTPGPLIAPALTVLFGLLVCWWGVACRTGRFPRNPILGYRTVAALRSVPAWNAAHRGYAPWIIIAGIVLSAAGVVGLASVLAGAATGVLPALGSGIVVLFVALILGARSAHHSLAAYLRENGDRDD